MQSFFKGEQVLLKQYVSFQGHSINRVCFVISFSKVFEMGDGTAIDEKAREEWFRLFAADPLDLLRFS
jgi:hypothetical protein